MYWHVAAYTEAAVNGTNVDIDSVADEVLTRRNSHLIFTEPYNLLAAFANGATLSRARFNNAGLTQIGIPHIWPLEVSATIPDLPQIVDMRDEPLQLPNNEELLVEGTTTGAGTVNVILFMGTPEWTPNLPSYIRRLKVRATAVVAAGSETTWTAPVELVFERDLLNGVYAVIGCQVVAANAEAFRLRFPDQPSVRGRQHRPGGLVQDTAALAPNKALLEGWGEWGRFHTFSPPEIQVHADAAGGTYEVRLDVLYLGSDESLLRAR